MSSNDMTFRVGEAARLAQVSVRTLHHYDEIGLLAPSGRSEAGYRLYTQRDLERLRLILSYKALGFGLDEIRDVMAARPAGQRAALERQREALALEIRRHERAIELIDRALGEIDGGREMTVLSKEEMREVFGDFDPAEYEDEAAARWGGSDAYEESRRRARRYTKEDWQRFKEQSEALNAAIVELMNAGVAPDDERAMDAVERCRLQIDEWFYPCSRAMHAALGRMYVDDARFTATYEKIRPGMAEFMHAATAANARRG